MSGRTREWWPAVPSGGQHQRPEQHQQILHTAVYWKGVQHDLSRAMPWALPQHIQAQRTSPTPGMSSSGCSSQRAHTGLEGKTGPSRHPNNDKQTAEHDSPQVLYAALFLSSEQQRVLLDRVPACFCNVRSDHMTLVFRPTPEQQALLPLGDSFELMLCGVVQDSSVQTVAVQLPEALTALFIGAASHITVSFANGSTAKQAGDLVRSICDGEDEPDASFEIWPKPLTLQGRLGLKLSDGRVLFEHAPCEEIGAPSRSSEAVPIAAENHTQPPAAAAEPASCMHPQHTGVRIWEQAVFACVGSQWWAQGSASIPTSGQPQCHGQASRQRDSWARGQCTSAYQPGPTQDLVSPMPLSHQRNTADADAAAVAELDGLLDSLEGPSPSRAMPLPMANGHRRAAKQAWVTCSGAAKRRGPSEDPLTGDVPIAATMQEAKHVSILSALQSAQPAGLVDVWREAAQASYEAHTSSSSSSTSQAHTPDQQAYTVAGVQHTLPVSQHLGAGAMVKWRTPVLESPQDGHRTPPELMCPSEALTHIQSQAGRAAAVAAATLDVEQTLQERAEFCELADTERRAFWVHRNARELLCQASVEAEQQGKAVVARELAMKSREQDRLAAEARARANEAAYDGFNRKLLNRWKIDLHRLHVDEALRVLESHLIALGGLNHPGGTLIQVITGVGRHSQGGVARILPAVVRYLTDAQYQFSEEHNNPGVICITLGGARNHLLNHMRSPPTMALT